MNNKLDNEEQLTVGMLEPQAKMAAADGMAVSLSIASERKYLADISDSGDIRMQLIPQGGEAVQASHWLKITQVGRVDANNAEQCFTAIQKILTTCFMPRQAQLLFLVSGQNGKCQLHLGLRTFDKTKIDKSFVDGLGNFISGIWPGMRCGLSSKEEIESIRESITSYKEVNALTGVPSMESPYSKFYPATIDTLMSGMRKKSFAYLVVADPVPSEDIDSLIYNLRDYEGQAESLKSITISENMSESISKAISRSKSESESENRKDAKAAIVAGVILAGAIFPPAGALTAALNLTSTLAVGLHELTGVNLIASFARNRSKSTGKTEGTTTTNSNTWGKSISQNVVNKHIEAVAKSLEHHVGRFEEGKAIGCWRVGAYLMTDNIRDLQSGTMQLKSLISGKDSKYEPVRSHSIGTLLSDDKDGGALPKLSPPEIVIKMPGGVFEHPFSKDWNDLRTVMTTKELSYLVNFPMHSVPGVDVVEASAQFSLTVPAANENDENACEIGNLLWAGSSTDTSISLPLDTLSRHALVCGVNGSGKTNTVLSILDGFMKSDKPFFVIEPAKTEYVDWAIEYNKDIRDPKKKIKIFIPGCENYAKKDFPPDKLKINPFEVIELPGSEMRALSHIDRLKSSFASAFPMQDILPVIMEHLLYKLYTDKCPLIDEDDCNTEKNRKNKKYPTLKSIDDDFIKDLMDEIGYARENTQNISAALRTRFRSLKYGWKKQLLDNPKLMNMTWDELFGSPVVVNLSYAGDDQDRAFIMSLLLQFLYEYRIAESESGSFPFNSNKCRHLVVVEEAHRVMGRNDNPESPQHKSGLMFSNFLSEVRAYGQGMMVVDQVPTRLIEDAIKNTNVKIIHKLVASDDAQRVAECIGLTTEQQKVIAKLSIGQAVLAGFNSANVMSANSSDIYLAQINKMKYIL